ncbi:MAG: IclR family transcriptional regulator [Actinobacteria bacterium]|nr:IclR family transcriptional regulator [Actinomycetota bacterium]
MEQILSGIGVLDKAMSLISLLERRPRTLGELVDHSGMSRSTTHRMLQALEIHGLASRDGDGRFHLGARLIGLGASAATSFPLARLAEPVLATLRDDSGESVQLYVRQGEHRVCLVALDSPHELRTIVAPGAMLPLGVGSAGRLLAGMAAGPGGWLESVEDRAPGVASVSAPVHDRRGAIIAAVSVSGPIERITRAPGALHGGEVVASAARLETLL